MWSKSVKEAALIACGRKCCVCHRFCGRNIELHHLIDASNGGESSLENCIPLCFDCHAEAGHYNAKHPRGTKYSPSELRKHRDSWYSAIHKLTEQEDQYQMQETKLQQEIYEGQKISLQGYVWREAFPGPPNYESFQTDTIEIYWMLVLPTPISLFATCPEHENTYKIENIKKLQLVVDKSFYQENSDIVLSDISVVGKLFPSHTGHHFGDACYEVIEILES